MNADPSISALIREVLAEELSRLKPGAVPAKEVFSRSAREETVSIASDADLQAFVKRLLDMSDNGSKKQDIRQGRLVFRLAGSGVSDRASAPVAQNAETTSTASVVTIDQGFFSERQVDQLPNGTTRVKIGKRVTMTPLARDRLRQRDIKLERTE